MGTLVTLRTWKITVFVYPDQSFVCAHVRSETDPSRQSDQYFFFVFLHFKLIIITCIHSCDPT